MRIAIIPARAGSKRIPGKNLKLFHGKPIIYWSICAAIESGLFDRVIVSTDSVEIAKIANQCGAETPFIRPNNLANDLTATAPVIAHALSFYLDHGIIFDWACCIYPCAPFILKSDLVDALELATKRNCDFVYPVVEYPHPIQRALKYMPTGEIEFAFPEFELSRTQDLDTFCHDSGQFYFGKSSAWLANKRMHTSGLGMLIPHWRSVDIDTVEDWERAELMHCSLIGKSSGEVGNV